MQMPLKRAGNALIWQAFRLGGVKTIFMVRLFVLAILLKPTDFGLIAIATSATGILLNLTNFGLVQALVQAEDIDETKYDSVWTFDISRSVIISATTIILSPFIASIFAEPRAVPIIQALAFRPLIDSFISIKVATLNRNLSFKPLALLKIIEAVSNTLISLSLAYFFGVWAIVIGTLGGSISMVVASYILAPYHPKIYFRWKSIQPLIKFGGWILVTGIVAMAGNYGLRIIISRQLGAEGLGLYFLAAQVAFLPSEIASEVVGTVAFPLYARIQSNVQQAARAFHAILISLMVLIYPLCALIIVLIPVTVQEILGTKWDATIELIQILSLVTMIGLIGDATIPLVKGFGQPHRMTIIELVQSTSLIVMIVLLTGRFGLVGAALAWIPTMLIVQLVSVIFVRNIFHEFLNNFTKPFMAIAISTLVGALVSAILISYFPNIIGLVVSGLAAVFVTGFLLLYADQFLSLGLVKNIVMAFPQLATFLKIQSTETE